MTIQQPAKNASDLGYTIYNRVLSLNDEEFINNSAIIFKSIIMIYIFLYDKY